MVQEHILNASKLVYQLLGQFFIVWRSYPMYHARRLMPIPIFKGISMYLGCHKGHWWLGILLNSARCLEKLRNWLHSLVLIWVSINSQRNGVNQAHSAMSWTGWSNLASTGQYSKTQSPPQATGVTPPESTSTKANLPSSQLWTTKSPMRTPLKEKPVFPL